MIVRAWSRWPTYARWERAPGRARRREECEPRRCRPEPAYLQGPPRVTFRVAEAGAALLPRSVLNAPTGRTLVQLPLRVRVTSTLTVQEPCAGMVPPLKTTREPPMAALSVPPQVVLLLPPTAMPLGRESTSADVSCASVALGLLKVMVNVELPLWTIKALDKEATRRGVARQALMKMWLVDRLDAINTKQAV